LANHAWSRPDAHRILLLPDHDISMITIALFIFACVSCVVGLAVCTYDKGKREEARDRVHILALINRLFKKK
jgi:hypothetical protein